MTLVVAQPVLLKHAWAVWSRRESSTSRLWVGLSAPAVTEVILQQVEAAGHAGVKPSHGYVIQRLIGNRPTIGQLADSLGMTQQGASKQITDLEHLGYVERVEDDDDERIRYVQLTAAGQEMLDAGRRARAEIERALVERVGQRNVNAAKVTLRALLELTGVADQVPSRSVPLPGTDPERRRRTGRPV